MGIQTVIVIASRDESQRIANDDNPAATREGFAFAGFDHVQAQTLLSLISSGDPNADFDRYLEEIELVSASSDEWPVVAVLIPAHVAELATVAALEDAEFEKLAEAWAATDEFDGWSADDVRCLLRELGDLAETASFAEKCMMIWRSS